MQEQEAVLETAEDADASPVEEVQVRQQGRDPRTGQFVPTGYVDDSIDTSPPPVEAEAEEVEVDEEPESEVDSSPTEVKVLDEKADSPEDTDEEFSGRVKERIDEVIGKWRDTERLVDVKDAENAELRKQLAEIPQPEQEPFKTLADFEYDEGKYQAYLADENSKRTAATVEQILNKSQQEAFENQLDVKFKERVTEFARSVKDYDEVTGDRNLRINTPMAQVIKAGEFGPELAYYLGKKPDVARKLSQMPAELAGYELGMINASLQADKAKAAPKKVTDAPPPPPKVKSGDEGLQRGFREGMSDAEFNKLRRKQIANR